MTRAAAQGDESATRRARLAAAKGLALGLLVLMAVLWAIALILPPASPFAGPLRAFAEAGVVGGCADWFAVVALFRRPLGLPIPHTAVIPENKTRIGRALGRFIVDNFLAPEVLDGRLRDLEVAAWGGRWLAAPRNARRAAHAVVRTISAFGRSLPDGALGDLLGAAGAASARALPLAPAASAALSAAWRDGRAQPLIEAAAKVLQTFLRDHEEVVLAKVQEQSWSFVPDFIDRAIARRVSEGLIRLLGDVQAPEHPWRASLGEAVEGLIERLAHDPDLQASAEALKSRILQDPRLEGEVRRVWTAMAARGRAASPRDMAALSRSLAAVILAVGVWLESETTVQRSLNAAGRAMARELVPARLGEIARYVSEVVDGWDAEDVSRRLELQVGRDLQFIRINGALVGGLVGLSLWALARLLVGR